MQFLRVKELRFFLDGGSTGYCSLNLSIMLELDCLPSLAAKLDLANRTMKTTPTV